MLGEELDAASAGHRVGYEDPAYFSRDYKKLFGAPPQRDIARLRAASNPEALRRGSEVVGGYEAISVTRYGCVGRAQKCPCLRTAVRRPT